MEAVGKRGIDRRKRDSDAPLPGVPNVRFRVPQTLERFELWGACGDLNLPSLPTRDPLSLARRAQRDRETHQFILVRATLRCNTLLHHFGVLPRGAEDELI